MAMKIINASFYMCGTVFWTCQRSEYSKFRIYQVCEYAGVLNMLLVLNMLGFWIYHSFKYVMVLQGSKFVWVAFVLHSPIVIPYLKEP